MSIWHVNTEATLRNAIKLSAAGDTIAVQAGDYHISMSSGGRYDIQITKSLNIIGEGGRANFFSDGHQVEKGIFSLNLDASETVSFDNIGFLNAHNTALNGAGIRQDGGNLNVNHSYFENSNNGILSVTLNDATRGDVKVTNSEFNGAGNYGYSHALYVRANNFIVEGNNIHDTTRGHHVKSLSDNTIVRGNILNDGNGTSSYAVEADAGGNLLVDGNTIIQGVNGENPNIISYGADRFGGVTGSVIIQNNLITDYKTEAYASLLDNKTDIQVQVLNNTIQGLVKASLFSGLYYQSGNSVDGVSLPAYGTKIGVVQGTAGDDLMNALAVGTRPLDGGAGNDTILGNVQADLLFGGTGNDLMSGGRGNDYLYGEGGNDVLLGGNGSDSLFGQAGNDIIFDVRGINLLWGGDGNDLIMAAGKDLVNGNAGADIIIDFGSAVDGGRLSGGEGNDVIYGRIGNDTLNGGAGNDIAVYSGTYATYAVTETSNRHFIENLVADNATSDTGKTKEWFDAIEQLQFSDGYLDVATGAFHSGQFLFDYQGFMQAVDQLDVIAAVDIAPADLAPQLQGVYATLYGLM